MAATQTKDAVTLSPDQLAAVIAEATAQAVKGTMRPENANATPAFWNGYGTKGFPKLARRTLFCGVEVEERRSQADEIRLFNEITTPGTYGPQGQYEVSFIGHGASALLHVAVKGVDTIEGRMGLPSLVDILQTIVREQNTAH